MRFTEMQAEMPDRDVLFEKEETIARDLERYKAFISASQTGTWEYFTESGFLWCNEIYFNILGRHKEDFDMSGNPNLKSAWIDLIHPDDVGYVTGAFGRILKNPQEVFQTSFRMLHADGRWIWVWSRGSMFYDSLSPQVAVIGTLVDITYHKEAEELITQERLLLRTLIDNMPDTVFVKDLEGKKLVANNADLDICGYEQEYQVLGKTDLELFAEETGRLGYDEDMRVITTGVPLINEERLITDATGAQRWLQISKIPIRDEEGKILRLLGIGHDITVVKDADLKLKKLNQELREQSYELSKKADDLKLLNARLEKQKEEQLEKAIAQGKFEIASEFLHDIGNAMVGLGAHLNRINLNLAENNFEDLKNLGVFLKSNQDVISGAIGTGKAAALTAIAEGIVSTQSTNGGEIKKSVNELLNIISHIQEILNIQREMVKGHKGMQERKPVNLETLINNCRSMLFAALDKKGIQVRMNVEEGQYIIKGDQTKLMQVILNILKNSIEAIDPGGTEKYIDIHLRISHVVELSITDNGHGFTQQTASLFFVRGFTTKKAGTGLGLYNCRTIIESHSGLFDISSPGVGLGATTTIKFNISS